MQRLAHIILKMSIVEMQEKVRYLSKSSSVTFSIWDAPASVKNTGFRRSTAQEWAVHCLGPLPMLEQHIAWCS
jgi:hypothetical protein